MSPYWFVALGLVVVAVAVAVAAACLLGGQAAAVDRSGETLSAEHQAAHVVHRSVGRASERLQRPR